MRIRTRPLVAVVAAFALLAVATAPAQARGERTYTRSCSKAGRSVKALFRTHLVRSDGKTFRVIYRVVYRVRGTASAQDNELWMFRRQILTYRDGGKRVSNDTNGAELLFALYTDLNSDARGHTLDSREWLERPAPIGTYRAAAAPDTYNVTYDYVLVWRFHKLDRYKGCYFHFHL